MVKLGVNIDHVATLRQARKGNFPEPVFAALIAQSAGADSIVIHLREDRRHIQDRDLYLLNEVIKSKLNLEMSVAEEIVRIASRVKPAQATLVPEKRQELTTEGGLDISGNFSRIKKSVDRLKRCGIEVSLFIDPDREQILAAKKLAVRMVELHTGRYADAKTPQQREKYFSQLSSAVNYASGLGLTVNAGHGLDYFNVSRIAGIPGIAELNIGYSIVCRAVMVGMERAVKEMKALIV